MNKLIDKLPAAALVVYLLSNMLLVVYLVVLQVDARSQRTTIKEQNKFVVCMLKIIPEDRTPTAVEGCKKSSKVD